MTYSILPDGTVTCEFNHELLQDVYLERCMGIMHQEKCDVFGEGVWRYIPKLQPFTDQNGTTYDLSKPYNITLDVIPHNIPLKKDMWERVDSPPDRQIDIIRGELNKKVLRLLQDIYRSMTAYLKSARIILQRPPYLQTQKNISDIC